MKRACHRRLLLLIQAKVTQRHVHARLAVHRLHVQDHRADMELLNGERNEEHVRMNPGISALSESIESSLDKCCSVFGCA